MTLPLSSHTARSTLLLFALSLCATLSYFSIRNARSEFQSELGTPEGYERAVRLEPKNFRNWYLLAQYRQYNVLSPDSLCAIPAYQTSLSLNPAFAGAWLGLGAAYDSEGNLEKARESFLRAKRAYPLSAEVSWSYGNFLLRAGEVDTAFVEIRRAVEADPKLGGEAFSRCWRADPDLQRILDQVLPANRDVYLDVIRELAADRKAVEALAVWTRLAALRPQLLMSDVFPLVDTLMETSQTASAWRVWEQAASFAQLPPLLNASKSAVWDASFESGVVGGGFAWRYQSQFDEVRTSLDAREKHSGDRSLRLQFNGKSNVSFDNACTFAPVQPSTIYRFSAWVRTRALTTDQGVRFKLISNSPGARGFFTSDVRGSEPWSRIETRWTAEENTQLMRICIVRNASEKLDNEIQGTAWVDDVALVPENAGNPKL